jgi:hypothetical protein
MKLWLIRALRALLLWLDPPPAPSAPVPDLVFDVVRTLVQAIDGADASGEYKRHQVYAQLIKRFPLVAKRDLGLLIERAVQEID